MAKGVQEPPVLLTTEILAHAQRPQQLAHRPRLSRVVQPADERTESRERPAFRTGPPLKERAQNPQPLTTEQVVSKYTDLARRALPSDAAATLQDAVFDLPAPDSMARLLASLRLPG